MTCPIGFVLNLTVQCKSPLIIVNPRSGGGLSKRRWAALVGPITDGLGPVDARFTEARVTAGALPTRKGGRARTHRGHGRDGTISESG